MAQVRLTKYNPETDGPFFGAHRGVFSLNSPKWDRKRSGSASSGSTAAPADSNAPKNAEEWLLNKARGQIAQESNTGQKPPEPSQP